MTNIRSYIFQCVSLLLSFINIKLFLEFLGDDAYSTWLIVFSVAGLVYALDLGIGSSVRNQMARLMAKNVTPKVQARLVINYYKMIVVLALGLGLVATTVGLLAHNLGRFDMLSSQSIGIFAILVFSDVVARAHHPVFAGLQQPHLTNFALAGVQLFIFLAMYLVLIPNSDLISRKLWAISFVVFGGSILINTLMILRLRSLVPLFAVALSPSILAIRRRHVTTHLKRGLPFFLLQIEFAVLSQIMLYFIYANFTNAIVVEIAVAEKVFAPFIILATIIMYPFWSRYTLLMHRGESDFVHKLLRRQEYFTLFCVPPLLLSIAFYDDLIYLWLNRATETYIFAAFAALKVFSIFVNSIYSYFMNGISQLRPQIYCYSIGLLLAIPVLYFASIHQNIYLCLSVTPAILLISAAVQRYFVFNVVLTKKTQGSAG